jgi:hypothetical protein
VNVSLGPSRWFRFSLSELKKIETLFAAEVGGYEPSLHSHKQGAACIPCEVRFEIERLESLEKESRRKAREAVKRKFVLDSNPRHDD